jgi:hypothetical protein
MAEAGPRVPRPGRSRRRRPTPSKREKELAAKTKELEAKLKKDHVIAEVTAELVATKKSLGSPARPLVPHDTAT